MILKFGVVSNEVWVRGAVVVWEVVVVVDICNIAEAVDGTGCGRVVGVRAGMFVDCVDSFNYGQGKQRLFGVEVSPGGGESRWGLIWCH